MADVTPAPIRLDDLARPVWGPDARAIRDAMAALAPECPLDADRLHARAVAETGLTDFGAEGYRERLTVFLAAIREIDGLDDAGIVNFHTQIVQWLKNRLLLTDLLARHPEIHDITLAPPVVIAGLPRSGTTHLHNLLAASGAFRTLPYWESNEPVPAAAEAGLSPDPRQARMHATTAVVDLLMPHFPLMHEMTFDHAHEEIQLLANDFSTMLFETLGHVPRWRDYYLQHDQTSAYEYLATLPVLNRVFPGLTVVVTHRDPVPVAVSMIAMIAYSARMHRAPVAVDEIAAYWVARLRLMLDALVRDRASIAADRSIDITFDDFLADETGWVRRVVEVAGEELTEGQMRSVDEYLEGHRRGRLGRVETSAAQFGLSEDRLRAEFGAYVRRFLA